MHKSTRRYEVMIMKAHIAIIMALFTAIINLMCAGVA